ncbi:MAG: hypothetical protein WC379_18350 [Methanoregula sp.]|jgi:uncharacterized BrkB/YihY/UPF0761 family membrane protein
MTDVATPIAQIVIDNFTQIILTGLIAGNVAAITLSVSGLRSMHIMASVVYRKNNPIQINNRYRYQGIPFKVLESTYFMVVCFVISEISSIVYLCGHMIGYLTNEPLISGFLIILAIISFVIGIVITLILYTLLFSYSQKKIPYRKSNDPEYSSVESIFASA